MSDKEKEKPLLTVRPRFDTGISMLQAVAMTAAGSVLLTIGGGTVLYVFLSLTGLTRFISVGYLYGFILVLSILVLPALFFEIRKKAFQRTAWHFYSGWVEFQYFHLWINRRRGRLRYADISDVLQQATTLQEQRGLIDIYIYAPSMAHRTGAFPGLRLYDLPQRENYLSQILDIIDQNRNSIPAARTDAPAEKQGVAEIKDSLPQPRSRWLTGA
jgi:hypothetical protein